MALMASSSRGYLGFVSTSLFQTLLKGTETHQRWWKACTNTFPGGSIQACPYIAAPFNIGEIHWGVMVLCINTTTIYYYDSLFSGMKPMEEPAKALISWLRKTFSHMPPLSGWTIRVKTTPRQPNGYDCGLMACGYVRALFMERGALTRAHAEKELSAGKLFSLQ